MKPLILIDSYAQIFRSFYAVRSLSNSAGEPSNAIFSMCKFLLKIHDEYPDFDGAFVFDSGRPPHRLALAPAYKANRAPMPEDLCRQMDAIRDLIRAFGWPMIREQDWEADDLIACVVNQFKEPQILIVSADKDLTQLIDDRVQMLIPDQANKGFSVRGVRQVLEKFGVLPDKMLDYLAMIGDSSDNIPGVDGVGPKTAVQLLNQCGSLEAMFKNPESIEKEKLRTKIMNAETLLQKNIQLIKLVDQPPADCCWTEKTLCRRMPDFAAVLKIAEKYELKSLIKELNKRLEDAGQDLFQPFGTEAEVSDTHNTPGKCGSDGEWDQPELF